MPISDFNSAEMEGRLCCPVVFLFQPFINHLAVSFSLLENVFRNVSFSICNSFYIILTPLYSTLSSWRTFLAREMLAPWNLPGCILCAKNWIGTTGASQRSSQMIGFKGSVFWLLYKSSVFTLCPPFLFRGRSTFTWSHSLRVLMPFFSQTFHKYFYRLKSNTQMFLL